MEAIREFYWNIPQWGRMSIILWITFISFRAYLRNLYTKKDLDSASWCMIIFIWLMFSILNHFGSDFNLISGG